tara:strand:- start:3194 stop:4543 length:1350 start_codon:yes stop_codon:yes gene_type:complete
MGKKFFLFRRSDPVGSAKRFSESGLDIPILGVPADQIAFMTAGKGQINITFNGAGMYEGNEMFVGDSLEKTNVTISCEEGKEMKLIESIMGFVSKDDGRTIMKFDVLNNNASFGEVIVETVRDINSKIKSQPTERISQKISTGDAGSRFRNIIGGINFGSRTNKPFLDYNHELLTGADDTTLTLWRNSGTGSSAYNLANHTGTVTVQTEATALATGLSKTCAQFAVGTFLNIPDVTIEDDYTIYFVIGDPGVGTNSFGALFGDDDGETLGFSKEGYGSLFTMRHDGLDGKPFEASTDTDENGSVRYNFPDKTRTTEIGSRQFCYAFVIRRDKDFNVYLHNHEGEIVAFVPAFTEKSTSKTTTKIKSKPTEKSKGIYETKSTPITSKITAGATGRTDGNLFLQRLGTAGTNITSSFSGTLARFGVIKRDIGDGGASQLAKDLYKLYKPIL